MLVHQGVTPVFVPPREPWRNGTIEHFNDTFDKRFVRQERFSGRIQLADRAGAFERFHNTQHRYRATHGQAPDETASATQRAPRPLGEIPAGWVAWSSSASSALTTSSACWAARSRCPTAPPTSTSPPRSTSPSPSPSLTRTTSSSATTKAS